MKQLFTFLFLSIALFVSAQNGVPLSLTGIVTDESNNTPVEYAAVVLKTPDSVYVADVFTNSNGKFSFLKVSSGKFYIEISYLGYEIYYSPILEITSAKEIGGIKLKKNSNSIKEVSVTATKNALEFKAGKTVYTVARDQTNAGLNGLEILRKIPGVFVDNDDNISVRGKRGIRVYIDDRPSALAAESPAEAIKFFPAGSIESIEVITNPGAKYDAGGSGAIINIKLKKEKKMGINGNYNLGAGTSYEFSGVNKFNGGLNANIRRNNTNVFLNTNLRQDARQTHNENNRESGAGLEIRSSSNGENSSLNGFAKAGVDYFINDKNTFGISYLVSSSNFINKSKSVSTNNYNNPLFPATHANSNTNGAFTTHTVNLNYIFKTKRAGEEFSFDVTHSILSRNNRDSLNTFAEYPFPTLSQYSNLKGHIVSNSSQVDYSKALKGDAKVEAGVKNSYTGNKSNFDFYNNLQSEWKLDSSQSNRFDYFENISAVYTTYSDKYKKWEYELGLRGEYTTVSSNINDVNQKYFNLFPEGKLSKKLSEDRGEISFSYDRRIDRVSFNELSNAVTYSDRYTGQRGNPKLKPELSNEAEVAFQKQFDSSKKLKMEGMGISLFGSIDKNSVGYAAVVDSNITYITFINTPHNWSYGGSYYLQYSYSRWYKATVSVSGVYDYFSATSKGAIYNVYTQHTFKFLKKHSINVNGFYFTKFLTPQGYVKGNYQVNAGYKFIFHKENASLSLNVSDIFKTGKYRYYVKTQGYNINGVFQFESRYAYLTFQYKFSKGWQGDGKKRTKKKDKDNRLDFENNGGGLGTGK